MDLKPMYYDRFRCIGGECSFTCCQEWKIAVDEETNAKWKHMAPPAEIATRRKNMSLFTMFKDGGRVIALDREHKCPFFRKDGLCQVVCSYGDECLSNTCRIFPREIHNFSDCKEYSLMPCCPEVIDLLNSEVRFMVSGEEKLSASEGPRYWRRLFADMIQREEESVETLLLAIFYLARVLYDNNTFAFKVTDEETEELLETIRKTAADVGEEAAECNELFLDLIDNYRREKLYMAYLSDCAVQAEQLEEEDFSDEYSLFKKEWTSCYPLMKKLLAQEMFSDLLIADEEEVGEEELIEHVMIHLEWIAMEYTMIRQLSFYNWRRSGRLEYAALRDAIVLTFRMTGYEDDDIMEYLENSFEDIIWDWGYMSLILGR